MKILHTADWHIGKRLDRFPRIEEQRAVLREIAEIADAEQVDLAIVAGDLYDVFNPGSDAEELLYDGLSLLSGGGRRPVIAIAGNHDSPDRVLAADVLAKDHGIILIGYPRADISVPRSDGDREGDGPGYSITSLEPGIFEIRLRSLPTIPIRVIATPYATEGRLRQALIPERDDREENGDRSDKDVLLRETLAGHWTDLAARHLRDGTVNLLVTHLFFAGDTHNPPSEPEGERPIGHVGAAPPISPAIVPKEIQYVACGHLHRPHSVGDTPPVRYAGSPLAYSFAESGQVKSVTIVELEPTGNLGAEPEIRTVPLTAGYPLLKHTADDVDAAIEWLEAHPDAYVELHLLVATFLSGSDRSRLHNAHSRLVSIVPIVEGDAPSEGEARIDPSAGIESLFGQYFESRHGSSPDHSILTLFREILGAAAVPEDDAVRGGEESGGGE